MDSERSTTVALTRTRDWRPRRSGVSQTTLSQNHHHRTPIGQRGLEQVHSHEQREPQEIRVDVDAQQHTEGHKRPCDQTKRTFDGHDGLLSTLLSVDGTNNTGWTQIFATGVMTVLLPAMAPRNQPWRAASDDS